MDVTQEIEQRAQQATQAGADHCALRSISRVTSTLASVYSSQIWGSTTGWLRDPLSWPLLANGFTYQVTSTPLQLKLCNEMVKKATV